jgi:hypothetical protein
MFTMPSDNKYEYYLKTIDKDVINYVKKNNLKPIETMKINRNQIDNEIKERTLVKESINIRKEEKINPEVTYEAWERERMKELDKIKEMKIKNKRKLLGENCNQNNDCFSEYCKGTEDLEEENYCFPKQYEIKNEGLISILKNKTVQFINSFDSNSLKVPILNQNEIIFKEISENNYEDVVSVLLKDIYKKFKVSPFDVICNYSYNIRDEKEFMKSMEKQFGIISFKNSNNKFQYIGFINVNNIGTILIKEEKTIVPFEIRKREIIFEQTEKIILFLYYLFELRQFTFPYILEEEKRIQKLERYFLKKFNKKYDNFLIFYYEKIIEFLKSRQVENVNHYIANCLKKNFET